MAILLIMMDVLQIAKKLKLGSIVQHQDNLVRHVIPLAHHALDLLTINAIAVTLDITNMVFVQVVKIGTILMVIVIIMLAILDIVI